MGWATSFCARDSRRPAAGLRSGLERDGLVRSSFEDWPLREQQVVRSLDAWARRGRRLTVLARRFDAMARLHPRFVVWRQRWDHLMECRVCRDVSDAHMLSVLWSPVWVLHQTDVERCTGFAGYEPWRRRAVPGRVRQRRKRQSTLGFGASCWDSDRPFRVFPWCPFWCLYNARLWQKGDRMLLVRFLRARPQADFRKLFR